MRRCRVYDARRDGDPGNAAAGTGCVAVEAPQGRRPGALMDWVDLARRFVPRRARQAVQRVVSMQAQKLKYFERRDQLANVVEGDENSLGFQFRVGIIKNRAFRHTHYVAACLELRVPFRVVDLAEANWWRTVRSGNCDAFLAWPDATSTPTAKLLKDRLDLVERELGACVYPNAAERWMYEDKVRLADWLVSRGVPHPPTRVFSDRAAADAYAATCNLPVVSKTAFGAAATGVQVLRRRRDVHALVARAFGRGLTVAGHDPRDRQWGFVLLQEYVDVAKEWRLVRIGEAYFGHPKGRVGAFHSGSGHAEWDVPEPRHLEFLYRITEAGGFRSMAVDTFETTSGELLVNELQTVFGASTSVDQMRVNGEPGRMVRDAVRGWRFEPGDYARNACANARVLDLIERWRA